MKKKLFIVTAVIVLSLFIFRDSWLAYMGNSLIVNNESASADVAVVLSTGVDYLPRLLQAAQLYKDKRVKKILINGNRKTDAIRQLEQQGFEPACKWYENSLRILDMHGVPRDKVWTVAAEDVFDSVSEAQTIKPFLQENNINSVLITTSKFHTRRARYVWQKVLDKKEGVYASAAADDHARVR